MEIPTYVVDAFVTGPFSGNPAAVCLLPAGPWPADAWLTAVAAEHNLSETAYLRPTDGDAGSWDLRWFTPTVEVPLCGHATLASAHVLLGERSAGEVVRFQTKSGELAVRLDGDRLAMALPTRVPSAAPPSPEVATVLAVLGVEAVSVADFGYLLVEVKHEAAVRAVAPDFRALAATGRAVAVTARADAAGVDFVSRFFAPSHGIDEDPVTGSAHCGLVPYWAKRIERQELVARQLSARGGELACRLDGDRVILTGRATTHLRGALASGAVPTSFNDSR